MTEKTTLLPSAPADVRFVVDDPAQQQPGLATSQQQQQHTIIPRFVIYPGLEFDPARKYRYGLHALTAAGLVFLALILVELRDCNGGPFIDLDRLQALHVSMLIFTFVLYLLSLFGIADFIFQYKYIFFGGILLIYTFVGLMCWMTYEAAKNTCVKTLNIPVDLSFDPNKNVFSNGDTVGIIVLILDIFATILMISAAASFYKRY